MPLTDDLPRTPTGTFAPRRTVVAADGLTPELRAAHQTMNTALRRAAGLVPDDAPRSEPTGMNAALLARGGDAGTPPLRWKHVLGSLVPRQQAIGARIFHRHKHAEDNDKP